MQKTLGLVFFDSWRSTLVVEFVTVIIQNNDMKIDVQTNLQPKKGVLYDHSGISQSERARIHRNRNIQNLFS